MRRRCAVGLSLVCALTVGQTHAQAVMDTSKTEPQALAQKRIAEVARRLSLVAILHEKVHCDLTPSLDGKLLSTAATGTPLPLDPGTHRLDVSEVGRPRWTNEFVVETGPSVQTLTIPAPALERSEPTVPPKSLLPLPKERTQGHSSHVAGTVLLGVGAVGVLAGGYFGVRAYRQAEEADRYCSGSICTMEGIYGYDAAHRSVWYSNAAFGVGVAGLATGLYLILASPRTSSKQGGLRVEGGLGNLRLKGHF